jgi:translation initiation factor IF-1
VPGTEGYEAVGRVVACVQPGVFRVGLPNGHQVLAYVPGRRRQSAGRLAVGDAVTVELSPFDLSKGRLKWVEAESDRERT